MPTVFRVDQSGACVRESRFRLIQIHDFTPAQYAMFNQWSSRRRVLRTTGAVSWLSAWWCVRIALVRRRSIHARIMAVSRGRMPGWGRRGCTRMALRVRLHPGDISHSTVVAGWVVAGSRVLRVGVGVRGVCPIRVRRP